MLRLIFDAAVSAGWISSRREEPKIAQDEILGKDPKAARRPVGPARNVAPARRIGITRQEVNRLTNLKYAAKIDRIDAALSGCGVNGGLDGDLRILGLRGRCGADLENLG